MWFLVRESSGSRRENLWTVFLLRGWSETSELEADALPLKDASEIKEVDFEKKLEESLKDL